MIFRADVTKDLDACRCDFFAVAPEFTIGDYENMNTGTMLMNAARLRESLPQFRRFIIENMETSVLTRGIRLPTAAFTGRPGEEEEEEKRERERERERLWDELPAALNWKPYWGDYSAAKIIHFHGPKPYQRHYIDSHYPELKPLTGGAYEELVELYESLLAEAG